MSDFVEGQGLPLLAHLLKRVSDEFVRGCDEWLPTIGITAPSRTSSTLRLLHERGPQTITEIADAIRQSHPLVITWVRQLERLHFVESRTDDADKRKRVVSLTESGRGQVALMEGADRTLERVYTGLFEEVGTDLLEPLWSIEHSLRARHFGDRLLDTSATEAGQKPLRPPR